jgi:hypothetical protein
MPRTCSCKYYTTGDETICPNCNIPLRFTLLPPAGGAAEPVWIAHPEANTQKSQRAKQDAFEFLGFLVKNWKLVSVVAGPLLVVASLILGFDRGATKDKFEAIRVGMTPEEVSTILYEDIDKPARFREFDRNAARRLAPDGTMQWSSGSVTIDVHFRDGRVAWKTQTGLESKR